MNTLIIITFIIGYTMIAIEEKIKINKAASALLSGIVCWIIYILSSGDIHAVGHQLFEHVGNIAQIVFFLLGAMTIVELIDSHGGFDVITSRIKTKDKRVLLWIISIITFFLSAILDNLTTAIVMVTLVRKLLSDKNDRLFFAGIIIIAANAGGAWSPMGDVTTTMLWIGGQITATNIIIKLFLPSLINLLVPLVLLSFIIKGKTESVKTDDGEEIPKNEKNIVFFSGIIALISVPVFKTITHLPPFMGMLISLAVVWIITELLHKNKEDGNKITVANALQKIDTPSILFFLGILLSVGALESTHILSDMAKYMSEIFNNNLSSIAISLGLLSSIVDNVPIVAATMGMYDLATFPTDHFFWEFIAYSAGTGGSILVIGSAAGVAAMGIEKIEFSWYLKKISIWALIGYLAGAFTYILIV